MSSLWDEHQPSLGNTFAEAAIDLDTFFRQNIRAAPLLAVTYDVPAGLPASLALTCVCLMMR